MDARRILIALVLALVLAGGATYFFYQRLRQQEQGAPQTTKVVATSRPIPAGAVIKVEDVTVVDWPTTLPLTGSFSKVEEAVGRSPIYPLGEKEPVLERDLAVPGSGLGLTAKIPVGLRATAVRSNEIVGVAGFLYPGSHVDVLATFHPPGGGQGPVTQTILQDVEVLTAGQKIQPDPQGKPETVNVVTLLLNPEDAQKLTLASTQATIQFVLRSGADQEKPETRPVSFDELIGIKKPPPAPARGSRARMVAARQAPKPPEFYTVEVIHGDKRNVEEFE